MFEKEIMRLLLDPAEGIMPDGCANAGCAEEKRLFRRTFCYTTEKIDVRIVQGCQMGKK